MNDTDPLTELKAAEIISDFNRRERLLKTIRGKPAWIYRALGVLWFIIIFCILRPGKADNNAALYVLMPLGFAIMGPYLDFSRRMSALIELIGEDNLRKPKTDDKEQSA